MAGQQTGVRHAGAQAAPAAAENGYSADGARGAARTYLTPIAPPATLGLFGFFASTMVVSTYLLGWWGSSGSSATMFEIAAFFGGLAQFAAGLWSFRARDYVGSALLTMWGTYWMAWGVLQGFGAAGVVSIAPESVAQPAFAIWFIPLGLFTGWGAIAALRENLPLFFVLATVGSGSIAVCGGFWAGDPSWIHVGAWLFVFGACWAWYTGAMIMLEYAWGRVVLPFGVIPKLMKLPGAANVPGRVLSRPAEYAMGQPGMRRSP